MKGMNGEAKEEVRSRLDIEAVIGEYVQLKRAGRNWKGLSPFSDEKTPSFFVSPDKGIWHDFSSNQGGDVFSFVMMVEGIDFRAALELLARKAGVDLSQYEQKSGSRDLAAKKKRLLAMHESAATFYQRTLLASPEAVEYVKHRGLNRQVVHDFRLGYAPADGRSLLGFLTKKGYSPGELKDGGLVGSRGTDLFRDRLMVPLMDGQGQVIGFTARLIRDVKGAPKYLNTPQTLLYDKGRHVFGLHLAKEAVRKSDRAVIVEGNLDVISSHQAEVKNVVATAGTALTDHHLKALSRLTDHIVLGFDADKAGIAATERAIPIAQAVGVELGIVVLPDDVKDPDELIQQDVAKWKRAIAQYVPAIEWVISQYETRYDPKTALGKRQLTTEALNLLRQLDDPIEQEHYLRSLSTKTDTALETLRSRMDQLASGGEPRLKPIKHAPETVVEENPKQDYLLALLTFGDDIRDVAMTLSVDAFTGDERRALFRYLVGHHDGLPQEGVPPELQPLETYVKIVQLKAETRYGELSHHERTQEAAHLVGQIKQQHLKQKKISLVSRLRDAESQGDESEVLQLRSELNNLIKEEHTHGKSRP
jgi:DNA primase